MKKEYNIKFHPKAIYEFIEQGEWYKIRNHRVYLEYLTQFENTILNLKIYPESYQKIHNNKRKITIDKFPISIVYSIHIDQILIISVFHNSRNPEIWKKRY
jgi:plasmid stabilization system protein ParE